MSDQPQDRTPPRSPLQGPPGRSAGQPIAGIKYVIPVASGKGGVGKSTVSANLALALKSLGHRVGLMDADVYGPSIPLIMGVTEGPEPTPEKRLLPPRREDIPIISMGFFVTPDQAVIWRGPMLAKMIDQFLGDVEWGELDYLIVDLPPGTGDIQLSLCQKIPLTGAVVVSTPQDAALHVAKRAVFMFRKLNCPLLGIIENMSYFICRHCGEREEIFGHGGCRTASEQLDIPFLGEVPLVTDVRVASDAGNPTVLSNPDSPQAKAFMEIARKLDEQVRQKAEKGEISTAPKITF